MWSLSLLRLPDNAVLLMRSLLRSGINGMRIFRQGSATTIQSITLKFFKILQRQGSAWGMARDKRRMVSRAGARNIDILTITQSDDTCRGFFVIVLEKPGSDVCTTPNSWPASIVSGGWCTECLMMAPLCVMTPDWLSPGPSPAWSQGVSWTWCRVLHYVTWEAASDMC